MIEKMVLIAASEKPSILILTSLQLMVFSLNCLKTSSFVAASDKFPTLHTNDSLNELYDEYKFVKNRYD